MEQKLIIAGIGGQGVIFVTKVLSQAGLMRGEHVMASENHGMSQRGGSVMSYVKIGGSEAPLIRRGTADALIGFDRLEAVRNLSFVRVGGYVCVNSPNGFESAVMPRLGELGIKVQTINADACAKGLGSQAVANLVVLGFAAAHGALGFTVEELKGAAQALGPAKAIELNLKALEMGANTAIA
ncbi:MAG TPA: 2-oxoacid:acceptor oxidoreductase family protein [Anaerolineales bacterium]|nr:2-oxoacid:acceptor oxidoreductase family protein [Anaerolineales bacterium]